MTKTAGGVQPAPEAGALGDMEAVRWATGSDAIDILDQTLLPEAEVRVQLTSAAATVEAIQSLRVRGAPAIGIAGAMAYALEAGQAAEQERGAFDEHLATIYAQLVASRPTGVNLRWALDRMAGVASADPAASSAAVADALHREATAILEEDRAMCRRIGQAGLPLLPEGSRVLTHCNAGSLATGGVGSALAPIYAARERGRAIEVFATETRPLLQGSRLTTYELSRAGVSVTLLIDSAAGSLMAAGMVDLVVVGADRIAANGDVANKIGTYTLAVLARRHGVPFYVAVPWSTIDPATASGATIEIEQRNADEVKRGFGRLTAPERVPAYTPAFDVTPAELVDGIITDRGILKPPFGAAIAAQVRTADDSSAAANPEGANPAVVPEASSQ